MKNGKRQKSKQIKHRMFQQMKAATGESYLWLINYELNEQNFKLENLEKFNHEMMVPKP